MPESKTFLFLKYLFLLNFMQTVDVEREESAPALTASVLTVPVRTVLMVTTNDHYYTYCKQLDITLIFLVYMWGGTALRCGP